MLKLLRKAANRCNALIGVSLQRTYLYRLAASCKLTAVGADPSASWELLAPENVGTLSEIGPFDAEDGPHRFRRGDVCYVAFLGGRLAHYSWVQRSGSHPVTEAGVSVPIGSGEFWIYHCRTADWARGKRIYPATLHRIVNGHFAEGYSTAWIYTSRENISSQKGILRAGFVLVATLRALRVGSRYYRVGPAYQSQ